MSLANSEIHQIRTYVRTNCLVKRSWLNKCGERGFLSNKRQCIKLKWLIEYIDYGVKEDTTISDSERWVNSMNSDDEDYMGRFNDYQV